MPNSEPRSSADRRTVAAITLLTAGIALLALSFAWTWWATGRSSWSDQQALKFQEASSRLHSLSHEYAHEAQHGDTDALRSQLAEAQARFGEMRAQLETAQNRPKRVAMMIRVAGLLMAVIGGAIYATGDRA
jgi:hypothetical protein